MSIVDASLSEHSKPICDAVTTDVGEPFPCSHVDCICRSGFSSFPGALLRLHGYGCTDFLLGRGGGIWIGAAAPSPEELLLPLSADDSLITLVKNFCAWLRIWTAVLVPMCSALTEEKIEIV